MNLPKYPIYIPSKNRADVCYTAKFFLRDQVDFKIVVEPSQKEAYQKIFGEDQLLILPEDNMKLLGSRLWIREHSIKNGFARHWQFDDNISEIRRLHNGNRIICESNAAIRLIEDFTDRYENIGLSGFNYCMFLPNSEKKPMIFNCRIYSATLINNQMPYKWRLIYNDDTDLCLQVLTNNLCTVLFNCVSVMKKATMTVKGGNTDDLYQKDGRLKMARTLEAMWPEWVTTKWRFGRPQHVIKNSWRDFKTPLIRRKDIDWSQFDKPNNYGMELVQVKEIKSPTLKKFFESNKFTNDGTTNQL
jgi:hypothetical protein